MKKILDLLSILNHKATILVILLALAAIPFFGYTVSAGCPIQPQTGTCVPGTTNQPDLQSNPIVQDINLVVNFLSALVGVVIVGSIIWGGIQYMSAGDNPQAVSSAKHRIVNALIALLAYLLTYAFLQWLIPGGVF
jgi:hypothetical protein